MPILAVLMAPALLLTAAQSGGAQAPASPTSSRSAREQVGAALEAGDTAKLRIEAGRLADLGYAPTDATVARITAALPPDEGRALAQRFAANRVVRGTAKPITSIGPEHALIEGVVWDYERNRMFATAVIGRELLFTDGSRWRVLPRLEAGSLSGIALDLRSRRLWVASSATERTPDAAHAFRGLISLDADTLDVVKRFPVPDAGSPFDIAIGRNGTVYASDSVRGVIYQVGPASPQISVLVPAGRLRSPQGIVPAPDNKRLYVADYALGLMVVNLADGSVAPLPSDAGTMLDGIDGLVAYGRDLIAIQNGTSPRRILKLSLDAAGTRILRADILESDSPEWGEPTLGFIRDETLLYVDGQGPRYDDKGKLTGTAPLAPSVIRALTLGAPRR